MTRFLRRREVEQLCGLTRSSLYALMAKGEFPKPVKVSEKSVRWPEDEIEKWQKARLAAVK